MCARSCDAKALPYSLPSQPRRVQVGGTEHSRPAALSAIPQPAVHQTDAPERTAPRPAAPLVCYERVSVFTPRGRCHLPLPGRAPAGTLRRSRRPRTPICTRLCGKQGRGPVDSRAPRTPGRRLLPGGESRGCPDSECQDGVPSGAAQVTQARTEPLRGPRCRSGLRPGPGPAEAAGRWLPDLFSSAVTAATPAGGLRGAPPGTASATVVQSQLPRLRPEGHAAHARRRSERVQARRSATGRAHV